MVGCMRGNKAVRMGTGDEHTHLAGRYTVPAGARTLDKFFYNLGAYQVGYSKGQKEKQYPAKRLLTEV